MPEELKVSMSAESVKSIMGEAILRSIDQGARDELIKQAIEHLIAKPRTNSFSAYDTKSPLEDAFKDAAKRVCHEVVYEHVTKDPEFRGRIKALITEAADKLLNEKRAETVARMADAIANGLQIND